MAAQSSLKTKLNQLEVSLSHDTDKEGYSSSEEDAWLWGSLDGLDKD